MKSLAMNLVKRVDRLPKPQRASDAMQPLFEAISNSIHSTQERFGKRIGKQGRIYVEISIDRSKDGVSATVADILPHSPNSSPKSSDLLSGQGR